MRACARFMHARAAVCSHTLQHVHSMQTIEKPENTHTRARSCMQYISTQTPSSPSSNPPLPPFFLSLALWSTQLPFFLPCSLLASSSHPILSSGSFLSPFTSSSCFHSALCDAGAPLRAARSDPRAGEGTGRGRDQATGNEPISGREGSRGRGE